MKIKATLEIINSKADIYGNRYFAFVWTDNETGKSVTADLASSDNVRLSYYSMGLTSPELNTVQTEMPIRQFNRFVKGLPYAGCASDDIAKFIKLNLK